MLRSIVASVGVLAVSWTSFAQAAPCAGFADVDSASEFCVNVGWMRNRGITLGCTATQYCPNDPTSRLQMAAFMNRLADSLFPLTCAAGNVMKWTGTQWVCSTDVGGGTVSSVTAGAGLTGGTITSTGTIAVDATYVQRRVSTSCAAGSSIRAIAADGTVTCETDDTGPANAFVQGGNAFGTTAVVGTTDNQAFDLRVFGQRVMRYEPNAISPNVIGGSPVNNVTAGVRGATIAGGGVPVDAEPAFGLEAPNRVTDAYGTVGGGFGNRAGNDAGTTTDGGLATVGGGHANTASGDRSTVSGGFLNIASANASTVCGGQDNIASGYSSIVCGGLANTANGYLSTAAGGNANVASGIRSTVIGGEHNTASGDHSLAVGYRAKASTEGSFIWADHREFDFGPTVPNFFGARATGGVGFTVAIDPTTGAPTQYCNLLPGVASWQCVSDREAKENFEPAEGAEILSRLVAMPLFSWNFKGADPRLRMLGPTAQDFRAAFSLGTDDKTIASANLDGVALAAIQGLNAKLEATVAEQARENARLRAELADLRSLKEEVASIRAAQSRDSVATR